MNVFDWLIVVLIIVHVFWTYKMFDHVALKRPEQRWSWILFFFFTGGIASYYYLFVYKLSEDKEEKKFNSKK